MNALMNDRMLKVIDLLEYRFKLLNSNPLTSEKADVKSIFITADDVAEVLKLKPKEVHELLNEVTSQIPEARVENVFEYNDYSLGVLEFEKEFTGEERAFAKVLLPENFIEFSEKLKHSKSISPLSLKDKVVKLSDDKPSIFIGEYESSLPPFKNEHFFCRVMFSHPKNKAIDADQIFNEMNDFPDNPKRVNHRSDIQSIKDTAYAINKRLKKELNVQEDLFSWKKKTVTRNY